MRNPYWTVLTRAPFSLVAWSVFGFAVSTGVITLTVPNVPQAFTFVSLGMVIAVAIAWMVLAVRAPSGRTNGERRR